MRRLNRRKRKMRIPAGFDDLKCCPFPWLTCWVKQNFLFLTCHRPEVSCSGKLCVLNFVQRCLSTCSAPHLCKLLRNPALRTFKMQLSGLERNQMIAFWGWWCWWLRSVIKLQHCSHDNMVVWYSSDDGMVMMLWWWWYDDVDIVMLI